MKSRHLVSPFAALLFIASATTAQEADSDQKNWTSQIQASSKELFIFEDETAKNPLRMIPAYKWSNPSRKLPGDRLCLLYIKEGRPVASCKVYPTEEAIVFTPISFATNKLVARRDKTVVWSPPSSPLPFSPVSDVLAPHTSRPRRGIQLKSIAREFSARTGEGEAKRQSSVRDLRLLPKPIYRYDIKNDKQPGVYDGAVFAFVTNGGNPQLFLLLEAVRDKSGHSFWQFGCTRRTFAELTVFRKKQEVWSVDYLRTRDMKANASFHKIRAML